MSQNEPETSFTERFSALVRDRYGPRQRDWEELAQRCAAIGGAKAPKIGAIRRYMEGSQPTVDPLVILAKALGVTVQWLATGEELPAEGRTAERGRPAREENHKRCPASEDTLTDIIRRSIHSGTEPERIGATTYPGVAFEMLGKDVLVVDFVVTGQSDRLRLPLNPKVKSESET